MEIQRRALAALICAALAACTTPQLTAISPGATEAQDPRDPAVRIRLYEEKLRKDPRAAANHTELGAAYLDLARETLDVAWLGKARRELERSLAIQPSGDAFATLAALCNFSHRFACALENAERTARASAKDGRTLGLRVDAYLGRGETEKAESAIVQPPVEEGWRYLVPDARGRWLSEEGRFDEALQAFLTAAEQARNAGLNELALRAEVNAGGAMLASGRPGLARPYLESAAKQPPASWPLQSLLQRHWARLHELEARPAEALRAYESILERQKDPEIYRRAYLVARTLGESARADQHFAAAERGAERIAAAGEIFALETQARLYADAGVKLERAEQIARKNLEHKRDRSAYETLAYVRKQRAAAAPTTPAR